MSHYASPFWHIYIDKGSRQASKHLPGSPAGDTFIDLSRLAWVIIGCRAGPGMWIWGICLPSSAKSRWGKWRILGRFMASFTSAAACVLAMAS